MTQKKQKKSHNIILISILVLFTVAISFLGYNGWYEESKFKSGKKGLVTINEINWSQDNLISSLLDNQLKLKTRIAELERQSKK